MSELPAPVTLRPAAVAGWLGAVATFLVVVHIVVQELSRAAGFEDPHQLALLVSLDREANLRSASSARLVLMAGVLLGSSRVKRGSAATDASWLDRALG